MDMRSRFTPRLECDLSYTCDPELLFGLNAMTKTAKRTMLIVSGAVLVAAGAFVIARLTAPPKDLRSTLAQPPVTLSPLTQKYVRVNSPRVVLAHVRVIDGTGKPAVDDQNVVIEGGKVVSGQSGADFASSNGVTVLDLRGYTVMPGIIGMHNHLYYIARPDLEANGDWEAPLLLPQMTFSSPRMYHAAGLSVLLEPSVQQKAKSAILRVSRSCGFASRLPTGNSWVVITQAFSVVAIWAIGRTSVLPLRR